MPSIWAMRASKTIRKPILAANPRPINTSTTPSTGTNHEGSTQ